MLMLQDAATTSRRGLVSTEAETLALICLSRLSHIEDLGGKLTNTGLRLCDCMRSMTAALIVNGNQSIGKIYRAWKNLVQDWICCNRSTWRSSPSPHPVVKLFSRTFSFSSTKVSFISHGIYVVRIASCTSSSYDYVDLPSSSQDRNLIHALPVIKIVSSPIFWRVCGASFILICLCCADDQGVKCNAKRLAMAARHLS